MESTVAAPAAEAEAAVTEGGRKQRRRRRRWHSSSALNRHGAPGEENVRRNRGGREGGGGGGHGRGRRCRGGQGAITREDEQRPRQEKQELRASDLARMREVVARLRFATRELEAERADRVGAQVALARVTTAAGGAEEEAVEETDPLFTRRPVGDASTAAAVLQDERACSQRPARGMAPGVGRGGGIAVVESEDEAAALLRENASLRRRLFGLAAVEELETRAVREGLLPLTGGGAPGADLFSSGS